MKFSACCTTRSRLHPCAYLGLVGLVLLGNGASAQQGAPTAPQTGGKTSFSDLLETNSLTGKGKIPFHLVMDFQVYALDGKAAEQGTLEEWWTESDGSRVEITAPSLGTLDTRHPADLPNDAARREMFLVNELDTQTRRPGGMGRVQSDDGPEDRTFGAVKLHCFTPMIATPKGPMKLQQSFCSDDTGTLRYVSGFEMTLLRNHPAIFHGTHLSLQQDLRYAGRPAISGHITKLESFDPATTSVQLDKPARNPGSDTGPQDAKARGVPAGVLAGQLVSKVQPEYPYLAKSSHVAGTVLLHAVITPEGVVDNLFPLSSPSDLLTDAAVRAVRQWKYRPYLLNGTPTAVDTTITVNFNLN